MGAVGQSRGGPECPAEELRGKEVLGMGGEDSQEAAMSMGRPLGWSV